MKGRTNDRYCKGDSFDGQLNEDDKIYMMDTYDGDNDGELSVDEEGGDNEVTDGAMSDVVESEDGEEEVEADTGGEEDIYGPSTYESISDIQLDSPSQIDPFTATQQTTDDLFNDVQPLTCVMNMSTSTICPSPDTSSVSYNTVPEEFSSIEKAASDGKVNYRQPNQIQVSKRLDYDDQRYKLPETVMNTKNAILCLEQTEPVLSNSRKAQDIPLTLHGGQENRINMTRKHQERSFSRGHRKDRVPQRNRPMTAFKIFIHRFRRKCSALHPNLTFAELTDMGVEAWKVMSTEKKARFHDEETRLISELNHMRRYQVSANNNTDNVIRHGYKNTRPRTAYQIFLREYLDREHEKRQQLKSFSRLTKHDLFMRGVRKWNRMTRSQKRPYEEQARILKIARQADQSDIHHQRSASSTEVVSNENQAYPDNDDQSTTEESSSHSNSERLDNSRQPTPPKKRQRIEFCCKDKVGQFRDDDTLETWYQASKGC